MFAMAREEPKVDGNLAVVNPFGRHHIISVTMISLTSSTYLMYAALENESQVPAETRIIFGEIIFPKYLSIQKYACFVRACFSSPFQELASTYTYIDVKQMVTDAVKICGYQLNRCDWPNQCLM